ncbi:MAG: tetratricopeptide repeat protein [Stenotrophobium sp.]
MTAFHIKIFRKPLLLLAALALAGCETMYGQHQTLGTPPQAPVGHPLPAEQPSSDHPAPVEATPVQPLPSYPQTADEISGAAVTSLMHKANDALTAGQPDQAAVDLGRALRIEPRNYFVWSALARTDLQLKNYDQAENVALRSNSLARGNVYVELVNWGVIRDSRSARNDAAGAAQAQAQVAAIQQLLLQTVPSPAAPTAPQPAPAATPLPPN